MPGAKTVTPVSGRLEGLPSSTSLTSYSWLPGRLTTQPRDPRIGRMLAPAIWLLAPALPIRICFLSALPTAWTWLQRLGVITA